MGWQCSWAEPATTKLNEKHEVKTTWCTEIKVANQSVCTELQVSYCRLDPSLTHSPSNQIIVWNESARVDTPVSELAKLLTNWKRVNMQKCDSTKSFALRNKDVFHKIQFHKRPQLPLRACTRRVEVARFSRRWYERLFQLDCLQSHFSADTGDIYWRQTYLCRCRYNLDMSFTTEMLVESWQKVFKWIWCFRPSASICNHQNSLYLNVLRPLVLTMCFVPVCSYNLVILARFNDIRSKRKQEQSGD